jgi:hypothetical protein
MPADGMSAAAEYKELGTVLRQLYYYATGIGKGAECCGNADAGRRVRPFGAKKC